MKKFLCVMIAIFAVTAFVACDQTTTTAVVTTNGTVTTTGTNPTTTTSTTRATTTTQTTATTLSTIDYTSDVTVNVAINYTSGGQLMSITYQKDSAYESLNGTTYTKGDLLPVWEAIGEKLNINFVDLATTSDASTNAQWTRLSTSGFEGVDLVNGTGAQLRSFHRDDAADPVTLKEQSLCSARHQRQTRGRLQLSLHRLAIQPSIDLAARAANRRTFGAVEHAELDAGYIGEAAHQAVERIDLPDKMALAETTDRGIAGHLPNRLELLSQQDSSRAKAGCGGRSLTAGMTAADNDDVERGRAHGKAGHSGKSAETPPRHMFHVKQSARFRRLPRAGSPGRQPVTCQCRRSRTPLPGHLRPRSHP